jgi:anti-sigma28 factor (negative regulator of flagellin synthesis)
MRVGFVDTEAALDVARVRKMVRARPNNEKVRTDSARTSRANQLLAAGWDGQKKVKCIRAARLAELRMQIEGGTYHFDSTALARKMLGLRPCG